LSRLLLNILFFPSWWLSDSILSEFKDDEAIVFFFDSDSFSTNASVDFSLILTFFFGFLTSKGINSASSNSFESSFFFFIFVKLCYFCAILSAFSFTSSYSFSSSLSDG